MEGSKCIFKFRGVRLFLSERLDIINYKNYNVGRNVLKEKSINQIMIYI